MAQEAKERARKGWGDLPEREDAEASREKAQGNADRKDKSKEEQGGKGNMTRSSVHTMKRNQEERRHQEERYKKQKKEEEQEAHDEKTPRRKRRWEHRRQDGKGRKREKGRETDRSRGIDREMTCETMGRESHCGTVGIEMMATVRER